MPEPVVKLQTAKPNAQPPTHKVTLVNGKSYTLMDPSCPGVGISFEEGVEKLVPEWVANRLEAKAVDSVTHQVGTKKSGQLAAKFTIEKLK